MQFFLDESGSTGGTSQSSLQTSFGGQRIFALAAIGAQDEKDLLRTVSPLLAQHKINSKELKASNLYKKKPQFIAEVFSTIRNERWPVLVEVVDKKYMLAANIVNCLVFPGFCFESESRESKLMRNIFAEYLFLNAPDFLYQDFLNLCGRPSLEEAIQLINDITSELGRSKNEVSSALMENFSITKDDISKSDDISAFIPIPDAGKHGKQIWMLPNLSSFTNLYARINLYMKGKLSDVQIFHDEQLQFDSIIKAAKIDVEGFPSGKFGFISDYTDYQFNETAKLHFKASHESFGIQIADLIAGFVMRFVSQRLKGEQIGVPLYDALNRLMTMNGQNIGVGMNMVMSARDAKQINRCVK